jgi:hypothetical protein
VVGLVVAWCTPIARGDVDVGDVASLILVLMLVALAILVVAALLVPR